MAPLAFLAHAVQLHFRGCVLDSSGVAICVGIEFGAISRVTILPPHAARSMI